MPDLSVYVKYKLLDPDEIKEFLESIDTSSLPNVKKLILENTVYNMKTEVTEALRLMPRDSAEKCIASLYNG